MAGDRSGSVSFTWLAGVLLTMLLGMVAYTGRTAAADIERVKAEVASAKAEVAEQKQTMTLRVQSLESQLLGVREAQEREHRLLVRIATRMGIEVAE